MKIVPIQEFDKDLWVAAHAAAFNPEFRYEMGFTPDSVVSLVEFYDELKAKMDAGNFYAWAALDNEDEFVAYNMLTKHPELGEWEIGTSVTSLKHKNRGVAARLHRYALSFAFTELEADWVWAVSSRRVPSVMRMMERAGYVPFGHLHLMHKDWFMNRWGGK